MSNHDKYFDLTVEGVAFANRVREVAVRGGDSYYGVTLAVLRGKAEGPDNVVPKTFIDCNVVGKEATAMMDQIASLFANNSNDDQPGPGVMLGFRASDLELVEYTRSSGEKIGQQDKSLKARLFDIKWYRVNGHTTYSPSQQKRRDARQAGNASQTSDVNAQTESVSSQKTDPVAHTHQQPVANVATNGNGETVAA